MLSQLRTKGPLQSRVSAEKQAAPRVVATKQKVPGVKPRRRGRASWRAYKTCVEPSQKSETNTHAQRTRRDDTSLSPPWLTVSMRSKQSPRRGCFQTTTGRWRRRESEVGLPLQMPRWTEARGRRTERQQGPHTIPRSGDSLEGLSTPSGKDRKQNQLTESTWAKHRGKHSSPGACLVESACAESPLRRPPQHASLGRCISDSAPMVCAAVQSPRHPLQPGREAGV